VEVVMAMDDRQFRERFERLVEKAFLDGIAEIVNQAIARAESEVREKMIEMAGKLAVQTCRNIFVETDEEMLTIRMKLPRCA
jgi:hypothetical protein